MKRQLSKGQKFLLLVVALVAGFYFYLNRVYDPVMHAYRRASGQLVALRAEVAGQEAAGGSGAVRARQVELEQKKRELEDRLAGQAALRKAQSTKEATAALTTIKRLALASGLTLIRQEARAQAAATAAVAPEGAAQFHWWEYQVVYEGATYELLRFLEGKWEAEYLVLIKNVQVSYPAAGGEVAVITIDLLI